MCIRDRRGAPVSASGRASLPGRPASPRPVSHLYLANDPRAQGRHWFVRTQQKRAANVPRIGTGARSRGTTRVGVPHVPSTCTDTRVAQTVMHPSFGYKKAPVRKGRERAPVVPPWMAAHTRTPTQKRRNGRHPAGPSSRSDTGLEPAALGRVRSSRSGRVRTTVPGSLSARESPTTPHHRCYVLSGSIQTAYDRVKQQSSLQVDGPT